jgi:hypothetical protein
MIESYLEQIARIHNQGDVREESYYSILERLLLDILKSKGLEDINITTQPKKTEAGNPDFRIWDNRQHIIGYIEAKVPDRDLQTVEKSEQLNRYITTFPNLILTNFLEFRLYRDGECIQKVTIGRKDILTKLGVTPPVEQESEFLQLLERFFSFSMPKIYDARMLAKELAKRTRLLRDIVERELKEENTNELSLFYKAFEKHLISDLSIEDFSDLYSQTITYGLFAARMRSKSEFNRRLAYDSIPQTIGILRDIFKFISLGNLPKQMEWIIDDISDILSTTDVYNLLDYYYHQHKGSDPVVHFYETFLSEYDPEKREKRGVYYTPEPVVSYIVRSVNKILKSHFSRREGLASKGVTVLDPAAGTLTFIAEAIRVAVEEFVKNYGVGGRESFIKEHILKNFYAFELMMAPYAIGHLKISFLLEELCYHLKEGERFNLFLTNALEVAEKDDTSEYLPGIISLSKESNLANKIKRDIPILVIIGNPPYSTHSLNKGEWISEKIKDYYIINGNPLKERNPKPLQDDYVKFIRFSQWKIEKAGEGILGFITNHSYLDNPTFRGMRYSLMQTFNEIYLLDLHGSVRKKERAPDGSKDENVFDIQQGVAIGIFIKSRKKKRSIYYSGVWGLREKKYRWLKEHDVTTTRWKSLKPKEEFYLFVARDDRLMKEYEKYPKITEILPINSVGVVTSRDYFAVTFDKESLKRNIRQFVDKNMPDEIIRQTYNLKDTDKFKLTNARRDVMRDSDWQKYITKLLYRPFDERFIFYNDAIIERSRKDVMEHMLMGENMGLITVRQVAEGIFNHSFITRDIIDYRVTLSAKGGAYLFPLYIYEKNEKSKKKKSMALVSYLLFEPEADYCIKRPNISERFLEGINKIYNRTPSAEEVLYYIYAILYSNAYRSKYSSFLKMDFPRIPFVEDYRIFSKLSKLGERLINLHLMNAEIKPYSRFYEDGNNRVDKLVYDKGRLFINDNQYFAEIDPEIYEYHIGGYQICNKWLRERKDRVLSLDEIQNYCRIVTILKETMDIQNSIDNVYKQNY